SYAIDQADEPVEECEHADRDRDREHVGKRAAAAGEDVCEEEHTSIVRPTPSRPHEVRNGPYTDRVKARRPGLFGEAVTDTGVGFDVLRGVAAGRLDLAAQVGDVGAEDLE